MRQDGSGATWIRSMPTRGPKAKTCLTSSHPKQIEKIVSGVLAPIANLTGLDPRGPELGFYSEPAKRKSSSGRL